MFCLIKSLIKAGDSKNLDWSWSRQDSLQFGFLDCPWLGIPLWFEGREMNNPEIVFLKNTWTAVEFHSHWYVTVPSLRKYPDITRCFWLAQCLVNNRVSVFVSIKQLSKIINNYFIHWYIFNYYWLVTFWTINEFSWIQQINNNN